MAQLAYGSITITDTNDIESIIIEYAKNQSTSSPPDPETGGWGTTRPAWQQGYYIWQRTRIHKSGTEESADVFGTAVCLTGSTGQPGSQGPQGPQGETGAAGRSLESTETKYAQVAKNSTQAQVEALAETRWTTNVPAYSSSLPEYWVRVVNTYSNPTETESIYYKDQGLTDAVAKANDAWNKADDAQRDVEDLSGQIETISQETALLGGHFIYNSDWQTTNTPHSANVVENIGADEAYIRTPSQWHYNVHIGANGIRLRYNELNLSSWTGTALTFYKPSLTSQGNKTMELTPSALTFYDSTGTVAQAIFGGTQATVSGTINAYSGQFGSSTNNYWLIDTFYDANQQANYSSLHSKGESFIQLGDNNTWTISTDKISSGWRYMSTNADGVTNPYYFRYKQFTTNGTYYDYGMHIPSILNTSDQKAKKLADKFLFIRYANYVSDSNLSTLETDANWTYPFYVDSQGNVRAKAFYIGDSTTSIGGGAGTIAEKLDGPHGSATQPVYFDNNGVAQNTTYQLNAAGAKGVDTTMPSTATDGSVPTTKLMKTFVEGKGYITGYTETDPTVPAWAKASTKPSYSLTEIGGTDDLRKIEALTGTSGFLKKTAENTWTLDTNTYLTSYTETDPVFVASAAHGITSTDISNWNSYIGTVTSVATGTGLTGGTITSSGTIKANLTSDNKLTNAAASVTEDANRIYPVRIDKNNKLAVVVPWTNVNSSYLTEITSSMVTSALGFTPYNATNPNGYTTNTGTVTSVKVQGSNGLTGSGTVTTSGTITLSHADTSEQASSSNSGRTYIQSITLDDYGHVTGLSTAKETVTNTHNTAYLYAGASNGSTNAATTNGNTYLILVDGGSVTTRRKISGSGTVSVTSDNNGNISIAGSAHPTALKNPNAITLNLFNETTAREQDSQNTPTSTVTYDGSVANLKFDAAGKNAITALSAKAASGAGGVTTFTYVKADGSTGSFNVTVNAAISTNATKLTDVNGNTISTTGSTTPVWFNAGVPEDVTGIAYSLLPTGTSANTVAIGNHTHTISLASDTATSGVVSLSHGGKYKLTAGGQSVIFTLPSDNNTDTKVKLTSQTTTGSYPLMFGPTSISSGTAYEVYYNTGITVNPNTSTITATTFSGKATSAGSADTASKLGSSNVGSATKPIYLSSGAATEGSTYAGGTKVTLNGADKGASTASFYAPTSVGTQSYVLIADANGIPTWTAQSNITSGNSDEKLKVAAVTSGTTYYPIVGTGTAAATRQYDTTGFVYVGTNGTANGTNGNALLTLGNSTASTTANWKKGTIRLYGTTAYYTDIVSGAPSANNTITLPNASGTVALTSQIPTVPTSTGNSKTGISVSISDHSTASIIGVGSTTTTASHVKSGGNGTAPSLTVSSVACDDITAWDAGSGSSYLTFTMDTTDTKKLKISFSHTHTAPSLSYTARSVGSASNWNAGSASNWTFENIAVPIKNSSSTTVVTGKTHSVTVTDNGHTHTI